MLLGIWTTWYTSQATWLEHPVLLVMGLISEFREARIKVETSHNVFFLSIICAADWNILSLFVGRSKTLIVFRAVVVLKSYSYKSRLKHPFFWFFLLYSLLQAFVGHVIASSTWDMWLYLILSMFVMLHVGLFYLFPWYCWLDCCNSQFIGLSSDFGKI